MACLPERVFYSLNDIQKIWEASESDIRQWLINGQLNTHIWLPMISVYEIYEEVQGAQIIVTKKLRHWEGYAPLYPYQCRAVFKSGKVYLRDFFCSDNSCKLRLPDTADSICVLQSELVILNEERKRFENKYQVNETNICSVKVIGRVGTGKSKINISSFDPSFKRVNFQGQKYSFGNIQAEIVRQLYEAAVKGEPWQNGKQILSKAGSQSFTVSNVFKRNPLWRHLIVSDGRGSYRLDEKFLSSLEQHQDITS